MFKIVSAESSRSSIQAIDIAQSYRMAENKRLLLFHPFIGPYGFDSFHLLHRPLNGDQVFSNLLNSVDQFPDFLGGVIGLSHGLDRILFCAAKVGTVASEATADGGQGPEANNLPSTRKLKNRRL
jgi:hypothetical protein